MIERVEEFFLGPFAASEVVDIVHEEDVDAPVLLPEVQDLPVLEVVDEVVHELFGRDVEDLEPMVGQQGALPDGVHQVRLPEPGPAVDVQRIVGLGRRLGDRDGRGVGELVARADDEILERVVGIQVGIEERARLRLPVLGGFPDEGRGRFVEDVLDLEDLAEKVLRALVEEDGIVEG